MSDTRISVSSVSRVLVSCDLGFQVFSLFLGFLRLGLGQRPRVFSNSNSRKYWRSTSAFPPGQWSQKVLLGFQCYLKFVRVIKRLTQSFEIGTVMQITRESEARMGFYYKQCFLSNITLLRFKLGYEH